VAEASRRPRPSSSCPPHVVSDDGFRLSLRGGGARGRRRGVRAAVLSRGRGTAAGAARGCASASSRRVGRDINAAISRRGFRGRRAPGRRRPGSGARVGAPGRAVSCSGAPGGEGHRAPRRSPAVATGGASRRPGPNPCRLLLGLIRRPGAGRERGWRGAAAGGGGRGGGRAVRLTRWRHNHHYHHPRSQRLTT